MDFILWTESNSRTANMNDFIINIFSEWIEKKVILTLIDSHVFYWFDRRAFSVDMWNNSMISV
jgi:hypothetical protein